MLVPLHVHPLDARSLAEHATVLDLPVWAPWPLPSGWVVTGHGHVGTVTRATATVFVCSGPNPLGGAADMVLTEMKDDELLRLVALDLAAAMKEG